jgi:membrane-associated phospholipid phosphatase
MDKIQARRIAKAGQEDLYIGVMAIYNVIFYFISGAFYLGEVNYLNLTTYELRLPIIPWTIWIYVMLYPFLIWTARQMKNSDIFNLNMYAYMCLVTISCTIFIIFPVSYPREMYPVFTEPGPTLNMFMLIRQLDSPNNCLPSLHVATCFLLTFGLLRENLRKGIVAFIISIIISYSTLTTKQHYIWDIVSGFTLASICHLVFFKLFTVGEDH